MKKYLKKHEFSNIDFLHNNSYLYNDIIITGTRGWSFTDTENGMKIINREALRLENSIKEAISKYGTKDIIVCMHYPPVTKLNFKTIFLEIMQKYNVKICLYGHLHANSHQEAINGIVNRD